MPTARDAMYACLAAAAGVTAVVGDAIYPDQASQDIDPPYLLVQVGRDARRKSMRGVLALRRVQTELTGHCATRDEAEALQTALEALFDGKSSTTFGGLTVQTSFISDDGAADEDQAPDAGSPSGQRIVRLTVVWWI